MATSESIMRKVMAGSLDSDTGLMAVGLFEAVKQQIFCTCGRVMDVRRAVYIETSKGKPGISCADCFDKTSKDNPTLIADFTGIGGKVCDGRVMHARGVL